MSRHLPPMTQGMCMKGEEREGEGAAEESEGAEEVGEGGERPANSLCICI